MQQFVYRMLQDNQSTVTASSFGVARPWNASSMMRWWAVCIVVVFSLLLSRMAWEVVAWRAACRAFQDNQAMAVPSGAQGMGAHGLRAGLERESALRIIVQLGGKLDESLLVNGDQRIDHLVIGYGRNPDTFWKDSPLIEERFKVRSNSDGMVTSVSWRATGKWWKDVRRSDTDRAEEAQ